MFASLCIEVTDLVPWLLVIFGIFKQLLQALVLLSDHGDDDDVDAPDDSQDDSTPKDDSNKHVKDSIKAWIKGLQNNPNYLRIEQGIIYLQIILFVAKLVSDIVAFTSDNIVENKNDFSHWKKYQCYVELFVTSGNWKVTLTTLFVYILVDAIRKYDSNNPKYRHKIWYYRVTASAAILFLPIYVTHFIAGNFVYFFIPLTLYFLVRKGESFLYCIENVICSQKCSHNKIVQFVILAITAIVGGIVITIEFSVIPLAMVQLYNGKGYLHSLTYVYNQRKWSTYIEYFQTSLRSSLQLIATIL